MKGIQPPHSEKFYHISIVITIATSASYDKRKNILKRLCETSETFDGATNLVNYLFRSLNLSLYQNISCIDLLLGYERCI